MKFVRNIKILHYIKLLIVNEDESYNWCKARNSKGCIECKASYAL